MFMGLEFTARLIIGEVRFVQNRFISYHKSLLADESHGTNYTSYAAFAVAKDPF